MTIAAAIRCDDGILFSADSQETSTYTKYDVLKIESAQNQDKTNTVVVTGSGSAQLLEFIAQLIKNDVKAGQSTLEELKQKIDSHVKHVFKSEVVPMLHCDKELRESFDIIVGVYASGASGLGLYRSLRAQSFDVEKHHEVGWGAEHGKSMFNT
jgi:hypothetical protein